MSQKDTKMETSSQYLPPEIIRIILTRLPVKTLIRFQCVCKQWKHLIETPSFIFDHLQQSAHQNPLLLIESKFLHPSPFRFHLPLVNSSMQIHRTHEVAFMNSPSCVIIIGSCNGLLCVETHDNDKHPSSLYLWNPATTACRRVPKSKTKCDQFDECLTAFGFSPIVDDYKIVRIYCGDVVTRAEVFSLRDSSWKEVDIGDLKRVEIFFKYVTFNGAIFCSGVILNDEGDRKYVLVSFDIAKEVFTLISMDKIHGYEMLAVYDNKFAVLCDIWHTDDSGPIDLWVMEDDRCAYGKIYSWTKICCSIPKQKELFPKTIWRNRIVFASKDHEKQDSVMYLMNVTTNEVDKIVIPYGGFVFGVYNYVESLVSVTNNCIEESGF